jgi:hypothetical protein
MWRRMRVTSIVRPPALLRKKLNAAQVIEEGQTGLPVLTRHPAALAARLHARKLARTDCA